MNLPVLVVTFEGNRKRFELAGGSSNRGFELSGFNCIFKSETIYEFGVKCEIGQMEVSLLQVNPKMLQNHNKHEQINR